MNKVLIVVDMQNDFIDGSLGTAEAQKIVPSVCEKIKNWDGDLVVTMDSHKDDYLENTLEGKMLPVKHCIVGEPGWNINSDVKHEIDLRHEESVSCVVYSKGTFGSLLMMNELLGYDEIHIIGLCTDICVISNAPMI